MFPRFKRVRLRSAQNVIDEIDGVNPEFVYFQDSCFGVDMKWFAQFSEKYRRKINIPFHCHLSPDLVDKERIALLSDANCMSIRMALEAASGKLRRLLGRTRIDTESVEGAARLLKMWGIEFMIQNMLGLPTSTIEDDLETLEVNIKCQPAYGWASIFQPYPGTVLGDKCKEKGWYNGDYSEITDCFFDTSVLNFAPEHVEQVECLQKCFALCVEMEYLPKIEELTRQNFSKLVHKILRRVGDKRLYGNIL